MESLITDTSTSTHPVIGVFPNNWEFSRFGREFERSNERNGDSPIGPMLSVSEYRGIEVRTNFRDGQLPSEDVAHYRVVRPGQLVANLMWLDHGGLGVSHFPGYVSPAYMAFNISERVYPAFAHHVLRSSVYVDSYKRLGRGVRPNSQMVDSVDLRQLPFPLPPFETQQRIADYLDRETADIDAAVADLDKYVELLDKRRQVMIAQSVTRGIGSDRIGFYHPSGMSELSPRDKHRLYPWLAFSNPDWEEVRFDSFLRLKKQTVGDKWSTTPLLSLTLRGVILRDITNNEGKMPASFADYQTVAPGDLVLCLFDLDETPRTVGLSPLAGMITSAYTVFEIDETVVDPLFFEFFLIHIDNGKMFKPIYSGLRKVVRKDALGQVLMKLPPLETQIQIASNLQNETAEIDSLIAKSTKLRDLLLKRRSVLITEVVTGRKQV